jgi:AcrR family transcriptional regulator
MSSDQRRQAIVEAAVQLFAQNGFRGTTTRQLAHAVGVTEPVLYAHFQTKRDLYSAIIEEMAKGEDAACCPSTTNDEDFFVFLASQILAWHTEDPTRIRLLLFSALEGHELSDLFYERHFLPFLEALSAHIAAKIAQGEFRPLDPMIAARAFCGMIAQFGQANTVFGKQWNEPERKRIVSEMVNIFLGGMRKPESENR